MHTYLRRALYTSLLAGGLTIIGSAGAQAVSDGPPIVIEAVQGTTMSGGVSTSGAQSVGQVSRTVEGCDPDSAGSATDQAGDSDGLVSSVVDTVESVTDVGGIVDGGSAAESDGEQDEQGRAEACEVVEPSAEESENLTTSANDDGADTGAADEASVSAEVTEPEQEESVTEDSSSSTETASEHRGRELDRERRSR